MALDFALRRAGVAGLLCGLVLCGCAAKAPAPHVDTPSTVVQAPDPAVIHRVWEAGYMAGFGAAERETIRRDQQQADELSNAAPALEALAPTAPPQPAPNPITAAPVVGFQSTGPATPVRTGN